MINIFDIFIAYVAWGNEGKLRPVLVVEHQKAVASVFNITTQYERKSEVIRSGYFKIMDWQQAGLDRPSYVDTNIVRDLPSIAFEGKSPIGRLTDSDIQRLVKFLNSIAD